jgi:hypothetical protein
MGAVQINEQLKDKNKRKVCGVTKESGNGFGSDNQQECNCTSMDNNDNADGGGDYDDNEMKFYAKAK